MYGKRNEERMCSYFQKRSENPTHLASHKEKETCRRDKKTVISSISYRNNSSDFPWALQSTNHCLSFIHTPVQTMKRCGARIPYSSLRVHVSEKSWSQYNLLDGSATWYNIIPFKLSITSLSLLRLTHIIASIGLVIMDQLTEG